MGGISFDGGGFMFCLNISRVFFFLLNLFLCVYGCEVVSGFDCICFGKGWSWLFIVWRGSGRYWDLVLGLFRVVGGVFRREI